MPETAAIRSADREDLGSLTALLETLFSLEEDFVVDGGRQRRGLELLLESDRGRLLVAEADGAVVGMCSGQLTISTAEGGPAVLVEDVVVREDWRGRGIGARLMDAVADWAMERGATRLQLLADRNNASALDFYTHLGWSATQLICLRNRPTYKGKP